MRWFWCGNPIFFACLSFNANFYLPLLLISLIGYNTEKINRINPNMITNEQILAALAPVVDPQSGRSVVEARMIEDLRIEGQTVSFSVVLHSLASEKKAELTFACQAAVAAVFPEVAVHVHITARTANAAAHPSPLPQVKNIIAVASGKGGVGKSTVALNLALALRDMGLRVGILDADIYGPSLPTMLGLKGERPSLRDVYGEPKMVPLEAHGLYAMSIGFIIEDEQAIVLRGPRLGSILKQFFMDCLWTDLDFLIVDLPPGTGDVQLTLVQTVPLTGVVLVTTPQDVALADAIKAMNMFMLPQVRVPILGVVENMSWFTPAELPDAKYYLFGSGGGKTLARKANSVLLGQIPLVQGIREASDRGLPILSAEEPIASEAFRTAARNLLAQVTLRHEALPPTEVVKMQS